MSVCKLMTSNRPSLLLLAAMTMIPLASLVGAALQPTDYFVYIGTSGGAKSKGVYAGRFNAATGKLTSLGLAAEAVNPSFVTLHPNGRVLYAVNEVRSSDGSKGGAISAYALDRKTGKLTFLNRQSTGGPGPCHLVVDRTGQCLLAANYAGGSICALPVKNDGRLGEATTFIQHAGSSVNPKRQDGPHAHGVYLDAGNRFLFVPDLGLDKVMIYKLDAARGLLVANDPPFVTLKAGSGPRHLAFYPNGRFAYVISELSSTLTAYALDAKRGALQELQTVALLPEEFKGASTAAEVVVHPNGKFVYGSNRGHDSIAVFAIDQQTGKLTFVDRTPTRGKIPRHFAIEPTAKFLLAENQATDNIFVFRLDPETGRLTPTDNSIETPSPICIQFVPVEE
jgi:6-phosphogluconolactonase